MQRLANIIFRLILFSVFFFVFYYYMTSKNTQVQNFNASLYELLPEQNSSLSLPEIYVWCVIVKIRDNHSALLIKFRIFLKSLFNHSKCKLFLNILTDKKSQQFVNSVISQSEDEASYKLYKVEFYSIEKAEKKIRFIIQAMQSHFSSLSGTYYSDSLFYMSLGLYRIAPEYQDRVILLDVDLRFEDSIVKLYQYFLKFDPQTLFGLAPELTPVYHHILWKWKQTHQNSSFGEPSWKGYSGLNSGVVLLNLKGMRQSKEFQKCITKSYVDSIAEKYFFKGHLGDQDFFTLLAMEKPYLVQILPCSWNRQLCKWWKYHGYVEVFDDFARCEGTVYIYHGNCNTSIPVN